MAGTLNAALQGGIRAATNSKVTDAVRHGVISLGIAVYLFGAILYCSPHGNLRDRIMKVVQPHMEYWGLWQDWSMFSANPSMQNVELSALVWFDDGTSTMWKFPNPKDMNLVDKFWKERWRKYSIDNLNNDDDAFLRVDAARYVARTLNRPGRHPVSIELIRNFYDIPRPEEAHTAKIKPHEYYFFRYIIRPGDL